MDGYLRHGCCHRKMLFLLPAAVVLLTAMLGCTVPGALFPAKSLNQPSAAASQPAAQTKQTVYRLPAAGALRADSVQQETSQSPVAPASAVRFSERADNATPAVYELAQPSGVRAAPLRQEEELQPARPRPEVEKIGEPAVPLPDIREAEQATRFPLNLGTALQLAGANNLQIALAAEQVDEALSRLSGAEVLWVPSLNAGVGYNNHAGRIQGTEGEIVEASRDSLFVGGGALLSGAPLTGASGGPARFFVDISPVDIFFEPLAARQAAASTEANAAATFNDTLLEVTLVYFELVQAQFDVAIAEESVRFAGELAKLTEDFVRAGAGLEADAQRAQAELAQRRRNVLSAQERVYVASAELARLLRLPQDTVLFATDEQPLPLHLFVTEECSLDQLIAQGLGSRPEVMQFGALVDETYSRVRQEHWRPFVPNLHVGMSGGGFGGGPGGDFGNFGSRTDFDALAVWELRNLGLGNRALVRERESQHRQAHLIYEQAQDRIAAEVTQAYHRVQLRRRQIDQSRAEVVAAAKALPLNFTAIRGRELRPIEVQQAINALAAARSRYLDAVVRYNQAQFALLRAIGLPPQSSDAEVIPVPEEVIDDPQP